MQTLTRIRLTVLATLFAVVTLLGLGYGTASAQGDAGDETPVGIDSQAEGLFSLTPYLVTTLLGVVIPLLNGLLTKGTTSPGVKTLVTLAMSAVAGVVNVSLIDGGGAIVSEATVKAAVGTYIVAIASYYGVFKNVGLTSSPSVDPTKPEAKLAGFGVI